MPVVSCAHRRGDSSLFHTVNKKIERRKRKGKKRKGVKKRGKKKRKDDGVAFLLPEGTMTLLSGALIYINRFCYLLVTNYF